MNNTQKYGLAAPIIPVALSDGLIPLAALQSDTTVHLPTWFGAEERDTYQLLLNGEFAGDLLALPEPAPEEGSELSLVLPVANHLKDDGIYTVGYRVTNILGGMSADSAVSIIRIDRTLPGAALLGPIIVPDSILTALLPSYAGMAVGDIIQTLCNGTEGPRLVVEAEHLADTPVTIQFERSLLQTFDSEKVTITYQVTDRAGNTSRTSYPLELAL